MSTVAVLFRKDKTLGGGIEELRTVLSEAGIEPLWLEISRTTNVAKKIGKCLKRGVDLLLVWGGDGTIRRCIDALVAAGAGSKMALGILPAGTANLLAGNLGIPTEVRGAVDIALRGRRRLLDVGKINGEYFAVMAGTGLDALMIRDISGQQKKSVGRMAYVWTMLKNLGHCSSRVRITVDGQRWFRGQAGLVLFGNVGKLFGNLETFPEAEPDDGLLDIGVVRAKNLWQWVKVLAQTAVTAPEESPLVTTSRGRRFEIRLKRRQIYQLDGGKRSAVTRLKVRIIPHAITVCVP